MFSVGQTGSQSVNIDFFWSGEGGIISIKKKTSISQAVLGTSSRKYLFFQEEPANRELKE
jgi:hypothetical protein